MTFMKTFGRVATLLILVFLVAVSAGCVRHHGSSGSSEEQKQPEDERIIPWNPGTVVPDYGPVQGGNTVMVVLPLGFIPEAGATEVLFGGSPAAQVSFDPKQDWFLTCTVPLSPSGEKEIVDVILNLVDSKVSETLHDAYTYIDPVETLDFLARKRHHLAPAVDLVPTDYNADTWTDLVGLHPEGHQLTFFKNNNGEGFVLDGTATLSKTRKMDDGFEGLVAEDINRDGLEDLAVFGELAYIFLINDIASPGNYVAMISSPCRRGIDGRFLDLNKDGFNDLIIAGFDAVRIFVYDTYNMTFPMFATLSLDTTMTIMGMECDDINGDGPVDIITVTHDKLIWYLGQEMDVFLKQDPLEIAPVSPTTGVRDIITADLNHDSLPDVIFTAADNLSGCVPEKENPGMLAVALSDGYGGLNEPVYYPISGLARGFTGATAVEALDMDMDGNMDVAVTAVSRNSVVFFRGNGEGDLEPTAFYGVGRVPMGLAVFDVDGDGTKDLVTAEPETGTLSLLAGINGSGLDGNNELRCGRDIYLDCHPDKVIASDLDMDGFKDIVAMDAIEGCVQILLNDGCCGLLKHDHFPVEGQTLRSLGIIQANPDEDQYPDLVVLASNPSAAPGALSVFINDGTGKFFLKEQPIETGVEPTEMRTGDVNNDGFQDIVVTAEGSGSFSIYNGDGTGCFAFSAERGPVAGASGLRLADLDNDFDLDAVISSSTDEVFYIVPTNNQGSLNLGSGFSTVPALGTPAGHVVADFSPNQDHFADIASCNQGEAQVLLYYNDAFMNFTQSASATLKAPVGGMESFDLDFDYLPDLCTVAPFYLSGFELLLNSAGLLIDADISPVAVNDFEIRARPLWIDMNNDVLPDLVMPSQGEMKLTVLINVSE